MGHRSISLGCWWSMSRGMPGVFTPDARRFPLPFYYIFFWWVDYRSYVYMLTWVCVYLEVESYLNDTDWMWAGKDQNGVIMVRQQKHNPIRPIFLTFLPPFWADLSLPFISRQEPVIKRATVTCAQPIVEAFYKPMEDSIIIAVGLLFMLFCVGYIHFGGKQTWSVDPVPFIFSLQIGIDGSAADDDDGDDEDWGFFTKRKIDRQACLIFFIRYFWFITFFLLSLISLPFPIKSIHSFSSGSRVFIQRRCTGK